MKNQLKNLLTAEVVFRHYNIIVPKSFRDNTNITCPNPSHEDKTASCTIKIDPFLYHCKSCGSKGDALTFISLKENLNLNDAVDFREIIQKGCDIAGIPYEEEGTIKRLPAWKKKWDDNNGKPNKIQEIYLERKGIDLKSIGVEWVPATSTEFFIKMKNAAGGTTGLKQSGRYVDSGSNLGLLYERLDEKKEVFLVEGVSDYLTMLQCGYSNTIGMSTATMPKEMVINMLKKFPSVKICLDLDKYDKKGNESGNFIGAKNSMAFKTALPISTEIYFASVKKKEDINDIFRFDGIDGVHNIFNQPPFTLRQIKAMINDPKQLDPSEIATRLLERHYISIISRSCWHYSSGMWSMISEAEVKSIIMDFLENDLDILHNSRLIKEIYFYIEIKTTENAQRIKEAISSDDQYIQKNKNQVFTKKGKYDFLSNTLIDYTPEDYVVSTMDVSPSENGNKCQRFFRFLDEIFEGDEDIKERKLFLQEWVGYCMYPALPFHRFLFIVGEGGNGKGILMNILSEIIGHQRIVNYEVSDFEKNNYATAALLGAYVNLSTDANRSTSFNSSTFKKITGGDIITARPIYKEPFEFRPFCKQIFASNNYPIVSEDTNWLTRRMHMIKFNNKFDSPGKQGDPLLPEKLKREKDGIFWWAIEGLKRLLDQKGFTVPPSVSIKTKEYVESHDVIENFIKTCFTYDQIFDNRTKKINDAYLEFREYCRTFEGRSYQYIPSKSNFMSRIEKSKSVYIENNKIIKC